MAFPNVTFLKGSVIGGTALAPDVEFFDDFLKGSLEDGQKFSTTADKGDWLATQTSGGVCNVKDDSPGGVLQIDGVGTTDQGFASIQLNGESWKVTKGKDIYFECRIKTIEPTAVDFFLGLATTDTNVLTGVQEAIGFGSYDTTADLLDGGTGDIFHIVKNSSSDNNYTNNTTLADSGVNLATTFTTLAFHVISSTRVKFYVDGNEKASVTTNIPVDDALSLTMAMQENAGSDPELLVDYIYCVQKR